MSATVNEERLSKEFWAITDSWEIQRVTGYECSQNWQVWWVPQLGYSMTEGHHLFEKFEEAKAKGLKELSRKIHVLKQSYNQLLDATEP